MEALESDFDLNSNKSHMKCSLNNDVSKQVNNSVVNSLSNNNNNNNINNNINHFKENNNFQNNSNKCHLSEESIECIQLEDESDDEPPNKMARLSTRASPERSGQVLQSLPSPPQSPLTSTQPFTEENEMEVNFVKQNNENNSENEDNLVETKICGNCFDRNECNRSECNTSECNGCESDSTQRNTNVDINSKSSIDNKHNVSTIETNNTFTKSEPNISVETISVETCVETNNENKSSLELSLKRLIAVCLEKRLQTFSQNFQLEVELSEKLDSFKCESIQRNNQLIELKRHKNGFIDKQIQVDFGLNDIPINERQQKCSKAGTECLVLKNDNKSQSKEEYSLLKEHLMTQNDTNNCIESDVHLNDKTISLNEPKLKNGLNPKLKEVLNNNQNVLTNNLRISESKALPKPQTNYSNNCDNSSDECEVVTIESDDEESKESIDVLKPSGVSWKSSKSDYNEALPSPKLSVSYSKTSNKANPSNHSVVSKGQNPSATEQVTLKWTIPKTSHVITKYLIYMTRNSNNCSRPPMGPIGVVDALDPPMACALSNLSKGTYIFYVRAQNSTLQIGPLSNIECVNIF